MKEKELSFEQSFEINQIMKVDLVLNNLEVFICDKKELKLKQFKQVYKRNLFNPFSLFLEVKKYLMLNSEHYFVNK
jgi:hypothetical protein